MIRLRTLQGILVKDFLFKFGAEQTQRLKEVGKKVLNLQISEEKIFIPEEFLLVSDAMIAALFV